MQSPNADATSGARSPAQVSLAPVDALRCADGRRRGDPLSDGGASRILRASAVAALAILAALAIPLSVVALWSVHTITNENGYAAALDPLASQPAIINALADQTVRVIYEGLPPQAPVTQANQDQATVKTIVHQAYTSPAFPAAWDRAVRQSHALAMATLTKSGSGAITGTQTGLVIDATAYVPNVLAALDANNIHDFDLERAAINHLHRVRVRVLDASQVHEARTVFGVLVDLGWGLPVVAIVALAASVLLARSRLLVLAATATGATAISGLCLLALTGTEALAVRRADAAGVSTAISTEFLHTLFHGLTVTLFITLAAVGAIALVCWVLELGRPTGRHRATG